MIALLTNYGLLFDDVTRVSPPIDFPLEAVHPIEIAIGLEQRTMGDFIQRLLVQMVKDRTFLQSFCQTAFLIKLVDAFPEGPRPAADIPQPLPTQLEQQGAVRGSNDSGITRASGQCR